MTIGTLAMLDQAELLQLALNASAANDSGTTIAYLKEAVSRPDGTALAHYILGAEYAQIKMYDRAIGEMEAALAMDPALAIARLQLGLLWLGADNNARANETLAPLSELPAGESLRFFGAGLQQLIRAELVDALRSLGEGVACNQTNPALNADIERIMREIEKHTAGGASAAGQTVAAPQVEAMAGQHILLSAYTGNENN
jgi:tetratricopeptide (TPR) repeat protein